MIDITKLNDRLLSPRHTADSSSSLTLVPSSAPSWSTSKRRPTNHLVQRSPTWFAFVLYCQPVLMTNPPPNRDQPLLKSLLTNLAKSCYWSGLIRPLVLLILSLQFDHLQPVGPSSKWLDQLEFFFQKFINAFHSPLTINLPLVKPSPPLRISATPPARKKIRLAKAFKCSGLVDLSDSSIQHQHNPPPSYLKRSNAGRILRRSHLFIRQSSQPVSPCELQNLSMIALCDMERSPNCSPEDSLDADQRHQRYYLVNSYRAKQASLSASQSQSPHPFWPAHDNDDEGLEPLEDLLDWDANTKTI